MSKAVLDADYFVGGARQTKLSPNFSVGEFADSRGKLRVHRELVAALQILRNRLGQSIKIESMAPSGGLGSGASGQFAWISCADNDALLAQASRMAKREDWLAEVKAVGRRVYVQMPNPQDPPLIVAEMALDRAIQVTAGFETQGDPYLQVTGNFDGAGLSFGPLQFNLGTGTLQTLFERFEIRDAQRLEACFGPLWPDYQEMMKLRSRKKQVAWADRLSRGRRKTGFDAQWSAALKQVGLQSVFRQEVLRYTYDSYGRKLIVALSWLGGLRPIRIRNFRALAALFDLCVQQGSLNKAHAAIRSRVALEDPADDVSLVRIAVEERGRKANTRWRADAISRRLCILERQPVRVKQNGHSAERNNRNLYLIRNAGVRQVEKYLL